jgi:hypothetical protein
VKETFTKLLQSAKSARLKSCGGFLSAFLGGRGSKNISKPSELHIKSVRVGNNRAFAVVQTPTLAAGAVFLPKVGNKWRMGSLLVTPAP